MNKPLPICKDCIYYAETLAHDMHRCKRYKPDNKVDIVTGREIPTEYPLCSDERKNSTLFSFLKKTCGKKGKYFKELEKIVTSNPTP